MTNKEKEALKREFKVITDMINKQVDLQDDANKMFEDIYKRLEKIEIILSIRRVG